MKKFLRAAAIGAAAMMALAGAANASVLYSLDVTTSYGFSYSGPGSFLGGGAPSPDTGFLTYTNSGPSTFTGTMGFTAVSGCCGDMSFADNAVTLAPGQSVYFAIGNEASNVGGFNSGSGVLAFAVGMFGATSVNLSAFDADIHSGAPRVSPCDGISTDAFVLQGGAPTGCDNGDGFEVTQANGMVNFSATGGGVPEPATWSMMLIGFFGAGAMTRASRRTRRTAAV